MRLGAHTRRQVAVEATSDPRTVERYCQGLPIRSTSEVRIRAALDRLGLEMPRAAAEADTRAGGVVQRPVTMRVLGGT